MSFLNDYPSLKIIQNIVKRKKIKIYLVGGFVRDYILALNSRKPSSRVSSSFPDPLQFKDLDFALEHGAILFARSFAKKIKGAFVLLDENHGCARVVKKLKGEIFTFDFADFRASTFQEDLSHRDFTINTLSIDVAGLDDTSEFANVLCDFKHGMKDIKAKQIKCVSVDVFKEDPLRMMRAFSLKAVLGFKIQLKTLSQIRKDKDLIKEVSYERIREELFKVLERDKATQTLKSMDRVGLLENIIPQIRIMFPCKQGTYHHLDVWPHSMETVFQMEKIFKQSKDNEDLKAYLKEPLGGTRSRKALMKLAALLHDIGKPETQRIENGRMSFHGHEYVGKGIVKHVCQMLKLSIKERHAIEDMVRWHLRPGYLSNFKRPSEKAIYRYFRDTKEEAVSTLLLSLADQRATRGPATTEEDQEHHEMICLRLVKQYFDKQKEEPFVPLITGHDLIKSLKFKPSVFLGEVLSKVREEQSLGKIKTKKEALVLARNIVTKNNQGENDEDKRS